MGYFAVLAQEPDVAEQLKVKRLHVNIWALRGLWFGRRLLYFDVGVEIELDKAAAPGLEVGTIELLLPFRVEEGKWPGGAPVAQDLYSAVIDEHSGGLIFGSPITVDSADGKSMVRFEGSSINAVRVAESKICAVPEYAASADSSLYRVPFQHRVKPGESVYCRTRWRVFGTSPLWKWTRHESGGRLDFRVCDTRQGAASQRDHSFLGRVLPVTEANVFVMAPGRYSPTNVSPEPKHIRTLEPGAWTDYLRGAAGWQWVASNLLVYAWSRRARSGTSPAITRDNPFRVFLAVNRPAARPGWLSIGYAAVGFALVWTLMSISGSVAAVVVNNVNISSVLGLIGITTILGFLSLVQRARPIFSDRARRLRLWLRRIERSILCR